MVETIDINRLTEEAKRGSLSIPLSQLPPSIRALLVPAVEEGQRVATVEQQELILHRRALQHAEHRKDWLEDKSPAYQQAYAEFFDVASNSERRLGSALSDLNESERLLNKRLEDVEQHAIHLPDGRLAFCQLGGFVYADGKAVGQDDFAVCTQAKKDADQRHEPLASWRKYSALNDALNKTIEAEQQISGVSADVERGANAVRNNPPDGEADLRGKTSAIQSETDDAVTQALNRFAQNKQVLAANFNAVDADEHSPSERPDASKAAASASFNSSSVGKPASAQPTPKVDALNFDQVISVAADHAAPSHNCRP